MRLLLGLAFSSGLVCATALAQAPVRLTPASAFGREYTVNWACPSPGPLRMGLPASATYNLRLEWSAGRVRLVSSPELERTLAAAEAAGVERAVCIQNFAAGAFEAMSVMDFCREATHEGEDRPICLRGAAQAVSEFDATLSARAIEMENLELALDSRMFHLGATDESEVEHRRGVLARRCEVTSASQVATDVAARERHLWVSEWFIENHLSGVLDSVTPACRNQILASYLDQLVGEYPDGNDCARESERCRYAERATRRFLSLFSSYLEPGAAPQFIALCQALGADGDLGAAFADLGGSLRSVNDCVRLNRGESVVVNREDGGSGIPARYALDRLGENTYRARINLDVLATSRTRARECLARDGGLLTTRDGRRLQLDIVDPDSPDAPPAWRVEIGSASVRSNSRLWASSADCDTLIHEMLHVLGLCDGYHEHEGPELADLRPGVSLADVTASRGRRYDCRAEEPRESVMALQAEALRQARSRTPPGGVLSDEQFAVMTQPGCYAAAPSYYACARFAYRTSTRSGGRGCGVMPAACEARRSLGGREW